MSSSAETRRSFIKTAGFGAAVLDVSPSLLAWMKQQGDLGVETELDAKERGRKRKQSKAK